MVNPWREAYLKQARSDYEAFKSFGKFMRVARTMPRLARVCGFPPAQFKMYLESLVPIAAEIEALAPTGADHPNPEYPWEQDGAVIVPTDHTFPSLNLARPKMQKMLEFIGRCFEIA